MIDKGDSVARCRENKARAHARGAKGGPQPRVRWIKALRFFARKFDLEANTIHNMDKVIKTCTLFICLTALLIVLLTNYEITIHITNKTDPLDAFSEREPYLTEAE